jgi:hypothetical protein
MTEIEVTVEDARRCNRLRGLPVATCSCRLGDSGWQECPRGAHLAVLDASVVRDVNAMLAQFTPLLAQPLKSTGTKPAKTEVSKPSPPPMLTGEFCREPGCGGFMVRTGSCMTCQSCGFNEGCG